MNKVHHVVFAAIGNSKETPFYVWLKERNEWMNKWMKWNEWIKSINQWMHEWSRITDRLKKWMNWKNDCTTKYTQLDTPNWYNWKISTWQIKFIVVVIILHCVSLVQDQVIMERNKSLVIFLFFQVLLLKNATYYLCISIQSHALSISAVHVPCIFPTTTQALPLSLVSAIAHLPRKYQLDELQWSLIYYHLKESIL